ncbi:alpha/beta fold hydrolase [Tepidamorphus sp. 3E244]|uniref:alpha/beta fold hydrolase n=1 Tax=Tepidamorphus sp. 3E244 TaxID=3385498 RepID=UPI0038FBFFFD
MPQIVFVPGLLCTADLFAPQVEALPQGWEATIANHTQDATMEKIAARFLEGAPDRFTLVGLSMGGYVTLEVMRQAPERVTGLVLMDTSARADRDHQKQTRRDLVERARAEGLDAVLDQLLPVLIAKARQSDEALVSLVRKMAHDTGVDAFARQQEAIMERGEAFDTLRAVNCPTLIVCGEDDTLTPPKLAREMVTCVPHARIETVPASGHLSTLEQPEALSEILNEFLREIESQDS